MTFSVFKNCIAWAQYELTTQLALLGEREIKAYICELTGVRRLKQEVPPNPNPTLTLTLPEPEPHSEQHSEPHSEPG